MNSYKVILGVSMLVMNLVSNEVDSTYPSPPPNYMPSQKGVPPPCAKSYRDTFCLDLDEYPADLILYLVQNRKYNPTSLLTDESRDTLFIEEADTQTEVYAYPPRHTYGRVDHGYLPPPPYSSPPVRHNSTNLNSPTPPPSPKYYNYNQGETDRQQRYNNKPHYGSSPRYYPKSPPKSQPWWKKIMQRVARQKRQIDTDQQVTCPTITRYIMPKAAQSTRGDWMFLVNLNDVSSEYTQLVKSETCAQRTCQGACNVAAGFRAVCEQKYAQKRLVALDADGSQLSYDTFWFPSCCVCRIKPDN